MQPRSWTRLAIGFIASTPSRCMDACSQYHRITLGRIAT
jgi:hypothetical protein